MRKIIYSVVGLAFINSSNSAIINGFGETQSSGISADLGNFIENGNFIEPQMKNKVENTKNNLPGWTSDEIERGLGTIYNPSWGNIVVVELDGHHNNILKQRISLKPGHYLLSFRWAGRTSHITSSAMSIYWNNQKIFEVSAKDKSIHSESIPISVPCSGDYILEVKGEGKSDTFGMTVTNFRLTKDLSKQIIPQKKTIHSNEKYLIEEKRIQHLNNQDLIEENTPSFNDQYVIEEKKIQHTNNQYEPNEELLFPQRLVKQDLQVGSSYYN